MALSNALSAASPEEVVAPTAPEAPVVKAKKGGNNRVEIFKQTGASILETMTEEQKSVLGSKSSTLTFVAVAQDPARSQPRSKKGEQIPSNKTVGYIFKCSEDITVPFAPLKPNATCQTDVLEPTTKERKAGEEFFLNNIEVGMLLSRDEYAGKASGAGGKTVTLTAKSSATNGNSILPILRTEDGSIKENARMIATATVGEDGKTKWVLLPEFEEALSGYYAKKNRRSANGEGKKSEACVAIAQAFKAMYASRK